VTRDGTIFKSRGDVTGGQNVYFDEALRESDISSDDTGPESAKKTYFHISRVDVQAQSTVSVSFLQPEFWPIVRVVDFDTDCL